MDKDNSIRSAPRKLLYLEWDYPTPEGIILLNYIWTGDKNQVTRQKSGSSGGMEMEQLPGYGRTGNGPSEGQGDDKSRQAQTNSDEHQQITDLLGQVFHLAITLD